MNITMNDDSPLIGPDPFAGYSEHDRNVSMLDNKHTCAWYSPQHARSRFWLIVVGGLPFAVLSVLANSLILLSLWRRIWHGRDTTYVFLIVLAACDVCVSLAFVGLPFVRVMIELYHDAAPGPMLLAHQAWFAYFRIVFALSHVSTATGANMILLATFERLLITAKVGPEKFSGIFFSTLTIERLSRNWLRKFYTYLITVNRGRMFMVGLGIVVALAVKGPLYFEIKVTYNDVSVCHGIIEHPQFADMEVSQPDTLWVGTWYRFYVRNFMCVIVPFFGLLALNTAMIFVMKFNSRSEHRERSMSQCNAAGVSGYEQQERIRAATRMLIVVVCTYLLSNSLNVIIIIWEKWDIESLVTDFMALYINSADIVSVLTLMASAARLPIYLTFNPDMRAVISDELRPCAGLWRCKRRSKSSKTTPAIPGEYQPEIALMNGYAEEPGTPLVVRDADGERDLSMQHSVI